jgi:uncharacterized protein (TIGR02145 family)
MKISFSLLKSCTLLFILILAACNKDDNGGTLAVIVTSVVDVVTPISATCSGNITSDQGSAPTEKGVCWSTAQTPDVTDNKASGGTGAGEFSYLMTGLTPQTTYYARAYVINKAGTAYGEELAFTTPEDHTGETGTITDIDGNVYQTIGIGSQYWTTENLKTTLFNDGTSIPKVADNSTWQFLVAPGYCWYNNDESANKEIYGALYNWYVVVSSKLPPSGWHVSTDAEWTILETYLGGLTGAGGKLKETGTDHWMTPNAGATNETGFTALPGGMRAKDGSFSALGETGNFWTTTTASNQAAWYRALDYLGTGNTRGNNSVNWGLSVRLVKD